MTPKPSHLPADPRDMTPAQILAEAARVLRNAGGERYGAGYSERLAEALEDLGI